MREVPFTSHNWKAKPTQMSSKRWKRIATMGFVYNVGESVNKITKWNAASETVICDEIAFNHTFSCIFYVLSLE